MAWTDKGLETHSLKHITTHAQSEESSAVQQMNSLQANRYIYAPRPVPNDVIARVIRWLWARC